MSTAVIEYEYKSFDPPPDLLAWDILATVQHAAGVAIGHAERYLAEIRTELEEAGLTRTGIAKKTGVCGRYEPIWREVWRGEEKMEMRDDEQHHRRQASAGKTKRYWAKANAARARAMKPFEAHLARLAAAAEKRYPELAGRATKAAELVRRGHVARDGSSARFSVCSQDGDEIYLVQTERRSCTCYDFKQANAPEINGAPMCKHRAAALMLLKIQAPDPGKIGQQQRQLEATVAAQKAGALLM